MTSDEAQRAWEALLEEEMRQPEFEIAAAMGGLDGCLHSLVSDEMTKQESTREYQCGVLFAMQAITWTLREMARKQGAVLTDAEDDAKQDRVRKEFAEKYPEYHKG